MGEDAPYTAVQGQSSGQPASPRKSLFIISLITLLQKIPAALSLIPKDGPIPNMYLNEEQNHALDDPHHKDLPPRDIEFMLSLALLARAGPLDACCT